MYPFLSKPVSVDTQNVLVMSQDCNSFIWLECNIYNNIIPEDMEERPFLLILLPRVYACIHEGAWHKTTCTHNLYSEELDAGPIPSTHRTDNKGGTNERNERDLHINFF